MEMNKCDNIQEVFRRWNWQDFIIYEGVGRGMDMQY